MRVIAALIAGSLGLLSPVAGAQDNRSVPRIAVLDWEASAAAEHLRPFRQGLRDLGYLEGQNIMVEYRFAEQSVERANALAAEIVAQRVSVIVAFATPAVHAAKKATSEIPIVFASADPVGTGLVSNLARPDGNLTGVSNMTPELAAKRVELLREILPKLRFVTFLGSKRDPATQNFVRETRAAAEQVGIRFESVLVGSPEEIDGTFVAMARDKAEAVIVQPIFAFSARASAGVAEAALRHRLPTVSVYAHFAQAGGLISYGPSADFGRRAAARYVDRILKGARPGSLPVEQPTEFQLVINLKTAKALGIAVPPTLLARADEVIE